MPGPEHGMASGAEELIAAARDARSRAQFIVRQLQATCERADLARQQYQQACDRAEQLQELWLSGQRGQMQYSPYARLQARLASMPVIEQAKGVLMAQCGWTAEEAFDALRKASQRTNIRVRDLAARIVATTANGAASQAELAPRDNSHESSASGQVSYILGGRAGGGIGLADVPVKAAAR